MGLSHMQKVAVVQANSYDTQIVEQTMTELLTRLGGILQFVKHGDDLNT